MIKSKDGEIQQLENDPHRPLLLNRVLPALPASYRCLGSCDSVNQLTRLFSQTRSESSASHFGVNPSFTPTYCVICFDEHLQYQLTCHKSVPPINNIMATEAASQISVGALRYVILPHRSIQERILFHQT